jgi:hypothetical protein
MIQMINYIHMHFVENGEKPSQDLKECAMEVQFKDWGSREDTQVLNANDNLFQLAFWRGAIWDKVVEIMRLWEECEIKGQKIKKVPKTKKANKSLKLNTKDPADDMKLIKWKSMQPLKDQEVVTPVLQRVILGELSLQEMRQELKRLKTIGIVQKAFLKCLMKDT